VRKGVNWLIFDRIMAMSSWTDFFGPPCTQCTTSQQQIEVMELGDAVDRRVVNQHDR